MSTLLVGRGLASLRQVELALARQAIYGGDVVTNLFEVAPPPATDEMTLVRGLATALGLEAAELDLLARPSPDATARLPRDVALTHNLVPLEVHDGELVVAVADPLPTSSAAELTRRVGPVRLRLTTSVRIQQALDRHFGVPMTRRARQLCEVLDAKRGQPSEPPVSSSSTTREMPAAHEAVRGGIEHALTTASTKELVFDAVLDYARQSFAFVAVFVLNKDVAVGWGARGRGISTEAIRQVEIPLQLPSLMAMARSQAVPIIRPRPRASVGERSLDQALAADLGLADHREAIAVLPLLIGKRAVALVYGDPIGTDFGGARASAPAGPRDATLTDVVQVVALAGAALTRVILDRKRAGAALPATGVATRSTDPPGKALVEPAVDVEAAAPTDPPVEASAASDARVEPSAATDVDRDLGGGAPGSSQNDVPTVPGTLRSSTASTDPAIAATDAPSDVGAPAPVDRSPSTPAWTAGEPVAAIDVDRVSASSDTSRTVQMIAPPYETRVESDPNDPFDPVLPDLLADLRTTVRISEPPREGQPARTSEPAPIAEPPRTGEPTRKSDPGRTSEPTRKSDPGRTSEPTRKTPISPVRVRSEAVPLPSTPSEPPPTVLARRPSGPPIPREEPLPVPLERVRRDPTPVPTVASIPSRAESEAAPIELRWTAPRSGSRSGGSGDSPHAVPEFEVSVAPSPESERFEVYEPRRPPQPISVAAEVRLPKVMLTFDAEHVALVNCAVEGGEASARALARLREIGVPALPVIMQQFPGPTVYDRTGLGVPIPPPYEVGPLIGLLADLGRRATQEIISRTADPSPETRFWAVYLLTHVVDRHAASPLVPRLVDEDPSVRWLASLAGRRLLHAYSLPLQNGHPLSEGVMATRALALQGIISSMIEPLSAVVLDHAANVSLRTRAALALGELRDRRVVRGLVAGAAIQVPEVAGACQQALVTVTCQRPISRGLTWPDWLRRNLERSRIEWLMDALLEEEVSLRTAAIAELKELTGLQFGYQPEQSRRDREVSWRRFLTWWTESGRRYFTLV